MMTEAGIRVEEAWVVAASLCIHGLLLLLLRRKEIVVWIVEGAEVG